MEQFPLFFSEKRSSQELAFTGIRDYFGDMSVCLVEWPEWGPGSLLLADLVINITGKVEGAAWYRVPDPGRRVLACMLAEFGA